MNVWKPVELAIVGAARVMWPALQLANRHTTGKAFQPKWAPAPLLTSAQRTKR